MRYINIEKIRAALFDMDGTLFDTEKANFLSYREALEREGLTLTEEDFRERCFSRNYRDFLPELYGIGDEVCQRIHDEKMRLYEKYLPEIEPNLSLFRIAEALRGSTALGLVTTASRKNTDMLLEHFGLEEFFDVVITCEDVSAPKPDSECYEKAMTALSVSRGEVMIFEDSSAGIAAAKRSAGFIYRIESAGE